MRGRRTQRERTELSDRRMFEATQSLILELGTLKTTLKQVGERAGYSRGLAHARFGSKEQLFLKLADRLRATWVDELTRLAEDRRGLDAIHARLDAIIAFARERPDDARVMYILWFESVGAPSALNASLARFHAQARDDIRTLVEQGQQRGEIDGAVDAAGFAAQLCGTMFGLCYQWIVSPEAIDVPAHVEAYKRQLDALLAPRA